MGILLVVVVDSGVEELVVESQVLGGYCGGLWQRLLVGFSWVMIDGD